MDHFEHASELEVVPLSSAIEDNDPSKLHPLSPGKKSIVVDFHDMKDKLRNNNNKHIINHNESKPIDNRHNSDSEDDQIAAMKAEISKSGWNNLIKIMAPSIGFFGCQFAWACQGGYVDPYLRQLGLPDDMMNYAWILGPISGLIFQPMIGVFSDHCESKFGRRRPFFLAGAVILAICLFLFSHAKGIGNDIFTDSTTKSALILAFICFWFLDFSTNFMEGPLRALCSDTLTESEQLQSNSWFGIMNGLASTGGFALGYMTNDIRIIFGIAAIVVISTSLLTSYLVKEVKHIDPTKHTHSSSQQELMQAIADSSDEELGSGTSNNSNSTDKNSPNGNQAHAAVAVQAHDDEHDIISPDAITLPKNVNVNEIESDKEELTILPQERSDRKNVFKEIGGALHEMVYGMSHMPTIVARCWIVQFCTYFSNFACWVYLTDYFGENIMGGDAVELNENSTPDEVISRGKYDLGVEYGNLAFMFIAGLSAIFSLCATKLVKHIGLKRLWICCLLVYSIVMCLSPVIHNLHTALFLFAFIGLPMGASFTLPWAVVSSYSAKSDPNNAGLWLSSLNIAECGPELTVGLTGGLIIDQFKDNVASVFFIAGIVNLISVFLVLRIDTSDVSEIDPDDAGAYDVVINKGLDDDEEEELGLTPPEDNPVNKHNIDHDHDQLISDDDIKDESD
mmetsp:Transcript_55068/g.49569  ORF Transcript_55068/g.49569 Transcript_55068/m.49569 type:complete len:679 (-) Transcript_55068:34-2070(-)|eukprot:CAMPEP_0201569466 /NCGR_PEP_ID=MMETSP0190_2-20130828/11139_1 /ASSEMBLY_ACC=CAM_ASM_000263 /TAXON_ID=37353 /ORGANISM="Rosalina sp." /LENGTH=678 /DNA_ID=CAMNT_0047991789 /DNA_START=24 /DNA_END=2060 /DNA_ORIENTATION=-